MKPNSEAEALNSESTAGQPYRLPDGSWRLTTQPLALDFAVVNALSASHSEATRAAPAAACAAHKCRHQRTEALCREAGITYQPIVLGMSNETGALLHRLARAVCVAEAGNAPAVHGRLLDQLAVVIARSHGRSVPRRRDTLPADATMRAIFADLFLEPECSTDMPSAAV